MLFTVFFVCLVHCVSADESTMIIPSCSDVPGSRMSFTPVEGVLGRYRAEHCSAAHHTSGEWVLKLDYFNSRNYCNSSHVVSGSSHSSNSELFSKEHNCSAEQTVCMSAIFDLVFSACYSITSSLTDPRAPTSTWFFDITNNYTKEFFHSNHAIIDLVYHTEDTTITWHTGVPLQGYKMQICSQAELNECEKVPPTNCTMSDWTTLKCRLAPAPGCHRLYLDHWADWITGLFGNQSSVVYDFCRNSTYVEPPPDGTTWGGWAWLGVGACLVLAGAALVARCLARALNKGKLKKKVQASWLVHNHRLEEALAPPVANPVGRSVLVLYARECAAAERAVGSLLAALREHVPGQVYDIFSPGVMAQCAGAPAEWVRGVLARPDCAVLLLQSPALHALYSTHSYTNDAHKLVSPLLGRRVCARAPQYGDVLLQLALRLIAENTHTQDTYKKYYIATITALPTEILPCVVPYARYPLPAAAHVLLRDISGAAPAPAPAPTSHHVEEFTTRLNEFVEYARDNPDYLLDELVFIDT